MSADGHGTTRGLSCAFPGCTLKWVNDYGRKLCSEHDRLARFGDTSAHVQQPIPETLRPATRPWTEPEEHDALPF